MLKVYDPTAARAVPQPADAENADTQRSRWNWSVCAFVLALGVLFLTMPAFFYPGDNFVPRAEAAHFLMTGEFGIPRSRRAELGEFVEDRGRYFIENDAKRRFFSKYGVAYTLLDVAPLTLERLIAGKLELIQKSGSLVWLLNLYNLFFSIIIFVYLHCLTGLFSDRTGLRALFVVCTFFGTFLWYYLRAHAHDIFQIAAFLPFFYHTLCFICRQRNIVADERDHRWRHLLAANVFLALLIHMRFTYVLFYVPLWGIALIDLAPVVSRTSKTRRRNLDSDKNALWALCLPTVLAIGSLLVVQDWKFESAINFGYSRTATGHEDLARLATGGWWTMANAPRMLYRYLLRPDNANIFLHYPLVAVALFGWLPFWRRYRRESLFCLAVSGCTLIPVIGMAYEGYGYGPRYLLPALIACSLPALEVLGRMTALRQPVVRHAMVAALAAALIWSCAMQIYVNSLPFFAFHHLRDRTFMPLVAGKPQEEAMRRCFDPIHIGLFHRELLACRREARLPPAVRIALEVVPPKYRQVAEHRLRAELLRYTAPNYALYWVCHKTPAS